MSRTKIQLTPAKSSVVTHITMLVHDIIFPKLKKIKSCPF